MIYFRSILFVLLLLLPSTDLVKRNKRLRRSTNQEPADDTPPAVADIPEEDRTREEWLAVPIGSLRLYCNHHHLSMEGTHEALVDRLLNFFGHNTTNSDTVVNQLPSNSSVINVNHSLPGPSNSGLLNPSPSNPGPLVSAVNPPTGASAAQPFNVDLSNLIQAEVRRYLAGINAPAANAPASGTSNNSFAVPGPSGLSGGLGASAPGISSGSGRGLPFLPPPHVPYAAAGTSADTPELPPVTRAAIDKIKNHEYVNFDLLLPNYSPLNNDEYAFQLSAGANPTVKLVPKNHARPKVSDFSSWMVAWTNFLRIYTHFYPHRVHELIQYQSFIADFAAQFSFQAWWNYDRLFRERIAQNPGLSWARVDEDLYNRYLRHSPLQVLCFSCRNFGHVASACPLRSGSMGSVPPFRAPQRPAGNADSHSSTISRPPSNSAPRADDGRGQGTNRRDTCFYYNGDGCNSNQCRYEHVCHICYGRHPASRCSKRFSK